MNTGRFYRAGNALEDGLERRGWLVGHFVDDDSLRHARGLEVKWALHPAGDTRNDWVTGETRTILLVLISGEFAVELRTEGSRVEPEVVTMSHQGDYAMWGPGVDHIWRATAESVMLTVRWPSLEGD